MIAKLNLSEEIPSFLKNVKEKLFDKFGLPMSKIQIEKDSSEYDACQFQVRKIKIRYRKGKITPKKIGLFVTLWNRNQLGITEPFDNKDNSDFYIIQANHNSKFGYFIFTKQILDENGILKGKYEGKRGFRVYPSWDKPNNKQGIATQKWQSHYFVELTGNNESIDSIRHLLNLRK